MSVNWKAEATINGQKQTLEAWLSVVYRRLSDQEIADILNQNGIECSRETIRSRRRILGLKKRQGVGKLQMSDTPPATDYEIEVDQGAGAPALEIQEVTAPPLLSAQEVLSAIRNTPLSLRELSRRFDRSEETIAELLEELRAQSYNILEVEGRAALDTKTVARPEVELPRTLADEEGMLIQLGFITDLHGGSTAQQITNLRRFIEIAVERGVRHFLVSGDISAGHDVYRGQIHDLYAIGADAQLIVLQETLPCIDGVTYYIIGGNHDYSFIKLSGYNIVAAFCAQREDCVYLGFDAADIPLTDKIDCRLWHPSGGVPYAVSYRLQKGIEQIAYAELANAIQSGENPKMRIVGSGHLHVSMAMWRGPILGLQCGCFEGQTNYLKRKQLYPQIGGYIVRLKLTDGGLIQEATETFIPFIEIENDYLNYPHLLDALRGQRVEEEPLPLFEWRPDEERETEDITA